MIWILLAANGGVALPAPQPEIIVTGSRVATTADDIAANITVLKREDFDVEKPAKLSDILRRVAGVHVDQVGGRGGTGSLYMRGADPNYTLVLVDGVRVNDPTNARGGSFDFSALDIADVERVEIARGPYSAVYGGDALAGVINIVTRHAPAEKGYASADAMGGAYDSHEISVNTGGPVAGGDWNMGFSDSHEGELVRGNEFDSQRVSGSFDFGLGGDTTVNVSGRYSETERAGFPDDSGGYEFAEIRDVEEREAKEKVFGAGITHHAGAATFGADAGVFRSRRPHRFAGRRARHPRSIWRAPEHRGYESHALHGHAHRHAEILGLRVAGLRRGVAARRRRERWVARFRRWFRAAHVVRAHAHLLGAVRGSAPRHELRTFDAGRRARRQPG